MFVVLGMYSPGPGTADANELPANSGDIDIVHNVL